MDVNQSGGSRTVGPYRFHVLAMAGICLVLVTHASYYNCIVDDAFIAFRYVDNLREGHGLVYNPGERVEGYTCFLWIMLLAGLFSLGADPVLAANVANTAFGVIGLVCVWRFGRLLFGRRWWALVPPLVLALDRTYAGWCTGGLGTKLFTTLVFVAASRAYIEHDIRRVAFPMAGLLFGLATLARPEGGLFFGVTLLWYLAGGFRGGRLGRLAMFVGGYLLVVVPHVVWRYSYYGDLLPNTFYAKVGGLYWENGIPYLWLYLRHQHLVPVLLALVVVALLVNPWKSRRRRFVPFALSLCAGQVAYLIYIGGDVYEFRFLDVILPWLALVSTAGAYSLARRVRPARHLAPAAVVLIVLNQSLPTIASLAGRDGLWSAQLLGRAAEVENMEMQHVDDYDREVAEWLKRFARPGDSLAIDAAGLLPYLTKLPTLDLHGLNDRMVARQPISIRGWPGHEKHASLEYIRSKRPTFVVILSNSWERRRACSSDPWTICVKMDGEFFEFYTAWNLEALKLELRHRGAVVMPRFSQSPMNQ